MNDAVVTRDKGVTHIHTSELHTCWQTNVDDSAAEQVIFLHGVIERLNTKLAAAEITINQLKGALGYEVPADTPPSDFRCGICGSLQQRLAATEAELAGFKLHMAKLNELREEFGKIAGDDLRQTAGGGE